MGWDSILERVLEAGWFASLYQLAKLVCLSLNFLSLYFPRLSGHVRHSQMFFSKKYVIYGSKYLAREIWEICCFVPPAKEAPGMAGKSRTARSRILLTMAERGRGAFPVTPRTRLNNKSKCCYVGRPLPLLNPNPPSFLLFFFLDDAARAAQYSLLGQ